MNISITNACNRRCQYCFQKDWYLSKKADISNDDTVVEMPVEEFSNLCDWVGRANVMKLLGGEPLLHSHIVEIINVAHKKNKRLAFISNISVDQELFDKCLDAGYTKNKTIVSFLINTDYPKSQKAIFKRNLEKLCETNIELSFSTTLLPGAEETKKAMDRMATLACIYKKVRGEMHGFHVRIAPYCPNPTNSTKFHVYDFTNDVISFINGLHQYKIESYGFDCPINLCELRDDFVDACREIGVRLKTERCSPETGMPFDVMVDHSVIWCSSANFLKLNDWRVFPNFQAAVHALSKQYYQWWRTHGESEKCMHCEKHNPGYCMGFCIAKTANMSETKKFIPLSLAGA